MGKEEFKMKELKVFRSVSLTKTHFEMIVGEMNQINTENFSLALEVLIDRGLRFEKIYRKMVEENKKSTSRSTTSREMTEVEQTILDIMTKPMEDQSNA
jgi:hypothetical protein